MIPGKWQFENFETWIPGSIFTILQNDIRYIYIGQRQGTINNDGPQVLDPEVMNEEPVFKVVYHKDRVWIFEITP